MPVIKILPIDILRGRASECLCQIALHDHADLAGEFERNRFSLHAELTRIRNEVENIGFTWQEFYSLIVAEMEIYESGRDEEGFDAE